MGYNITVFGLGFVGLTTALGFAEKGHRVYGYDVNKDRADIIRKGKTPFFEPGLDKALLRHINKNFIITEEPETAAEESNFIFLCVGTPCKDSGQADLRYIYSAIDEIGDVLRDNKFRVLVIKSTIPPSTTKEHIIPYLKNKGLKPNESFGVANNPEFLREGKCWEDFMNADRIVCGVEDEKTGKLLRSLYSGFEAPFFNVSLNTGEFIKYLSNTLLATMISYSNEMSRIASAIGDIQIKEAFNILHMDKRWGGCNMASYVYPGCGYGGYCLPKDTRAMYAASLNSGYEPMILKNVIDINDTMPLFMAEKIKAVSNQNESIAILGLSFKPNSDDVRDSVSAKIIRLLLDSGYSNLNAYDPVANKEFEKSYSDIKINYFDDMDEICRKSDVLVIATAWEEFKEISIKYTGKRIVDCRYFL
jgi:UDPglucose 6-dehydrogenase